MSRSKCCPEVGSCEEKGPGAARRSRDEGEAVETGGRNGDTVQENNRQGWSSHGKRGRQVLRSQVSGLCSWTYCVRAEVRMRVTGLVGLEAGSEGLRKEFQNFKAVRQAVGFSVFNPMQV